MPATAPDEVFEQLAEHSDRVFLAVRLDPHDGMAGIRRLRWLAERYPGVRSVSLSPHMTYPLIAPNSREYYPIYAACVELELAVFVNVGFPAPRVPGRRAGSRYTSTRCAGSSPSSPWSCGTAASPGSRPA